MAVLYFVYSCAFTVESQPLVNQNFTNQMQVVAYTVSVIVISIVVHSNQFKAFGFVNLTKKKLPFTNLIDSNLSNIVTVPRRWTLKTAD